MKGEDLRTTRIVIYHYTNEKLLGKKGIWNQGSIMISSNKNKGIKSKVQTFNSMKDLVLKYEKILKDSDVQLMKGKKIDGKLWVAPTSFSDEDKSSFAEVEK